MILICLCMYVWETGVQFVRSMIPGTALSYSIMWDRPLPFGFVVFALLLLLLVLLLLLLLLVLLLLLELLLLLCCCYLTVSTGTHIQQYHYWRAEALRCALSNVSVMSSKHTGLSTEYLPYYSGSTPRGSVLVLYRRDTNYVVTHTGIMQLTPGVHKYS